MSNNIVNSNVAITAVLYDNIKVFRSNIGEKCIIADNCDISDCRISDWSEVGRRNQMKSVLFGRGTYTSSNCIIKNTNIGNYCCIGPNVYVGGVITIMIISPCIQIIGGTGHLDYVLKKEKNWSALKLAMMCGLVPA